MLFFFGLGQTRITTTALPGVACTHCATPDSLTATVFSRYFHFFWIPVIPLGKFSLTQCGHCKQVLEKREMPAAYQAPVAAAQNQAKLPVTNYLALILLGLAVLFIMGVGIFSDKPTTGSSAAATASSLAEKDPAIMPTVGAVYSMPMGVGRYSLMQVTKATPDSLYFRITDPLAAATSEEVITSALRDSVHAANQATPYSKQQWQIVQQYNKELKRLR